MCFRISTVNKWKSYTSVWISRALLLLVVVVIVAVVEVEVIGNKVARTETEE